MGHHPRRARILMIYRSNIVAPDLAPQFAATTICKPRPWSMGHDVLSDAEFEPECGFVTHDEAAILYECAERVKGEWIDIGGRLGWTGAHIAEAGARVILVDPMYSDSDFCTRLIRNIRKWLDGGHTRVFVGESQEFFRKLPTTIKPQSYQGVCIDGNHDAPEPLNDARNALAHLTETGVIIFHDALGAPILDGVRWLVEQGLKHKFYATPNGIAICWRGDFEPPEHIPDPIVRDSVWHRLRI